VRYFGEKIIVKNAHTLTSDNLRPIMGNLRLQRIWMTSAITSAVKGFCDGEQRVSARSYVRSCYLRHKTDANTHQRLFKEHLRRVWPSQITYFAILNVHSEKEKREREGVCARHAPSNVIRDLEPEFCFQCNFSCDCHVIPAIYTEDTNSEGDPQLHIFYSKKVRKIN
jgi:hypothetical protein